MGEIKDPSGVSTVGNKVCGDVMRLYLKVEKDKIKSWTQKGAQITTGVAKLLK